MTFNNTRTTRGRNGVAYVEDDEARRADGYIIPEVTLSDHLQNEARFLGVEHGAEAIANDWARIPFPGGYGMNQGMVFQVLNHEPIEGYFTDGPDDIISDRIINAYEAGFALGLANPEG